MKLRNCIFACACVLSAPQTLMAETTTNAKIAHELANPVADLMSFPFQLNYESGIGPNDGSRTTLNIQPIIPMELGPNWNLISRTIVPLIHQENVFGASGSQSGLGDVLQSFFFSPVQPSDSGWVWGAGPAILMPTATDDLLGADQWAAGPTFAAIKQTGQWTFGGLLNHLWSFAGDHNKPDINQTFFQPYFAYTTGDAWQFIGQIEATYNWDTEEWGVPIAAQVGRTVTVAGRPVSFNAGVRYWVESPQNGPDGFSFRFVTTLVFPK